MQRRKFDTGLAHGANMVCFRVEEEEDTGLAHVAKDNLEMATGQIASIFPLRKNHTKRHFAQTLHEQLAVFHKCCQHYDSDARGKPPEEEQGEVYTGLAHVANLVCCSQSPVSYTHLRAHET